MADQVAWKVAPKSYLGGKTRETVESVTSGSNRAAILPMDSSVPEHLRTINTEQGTVLYDPKKIRARSVRRAIKFGRLHELTGGEPPKKSGLTFLFKGKKAK